MAEELSKLSVIFLLDTSRFERSLTDTQKKMRRVGRELSDLGKRMTIGLTVPIALAGKRITETATAFEYQMARVQAISGATSSAFKQLQGNAEALGASTIFTAREVGALQEEFAKLGFTAQEITKVTESTLSLAQVTGATLPRAAEIAGSTLRTFNMDASRVGEVNDLVAVAISRSALDFESFAETMKYAGSQAAVSGVTMSELGAAMGVLANRGVKGSIAGTRLRMIFAKLTEEGGDTHKKFLDLVHGSMSMAEAIDRFGIRAATAIPVLQENAAEFDRLDRQMQLAHGTLEIMQAEMDDTSFAAQKKLKSALEDVSIQLGKALLPMINAVANALVKVANGFASLPKFFQTLIVVIGTLVAAIGPLLLVFGSLNHSMVTISLLSPKLATALSSMFGPIGIAVTLIGTLALSFLSAASEAEKLEGVGDRTNRAMLQAKEATLKATSSVRMLIDQYQNENRTLEEKQRILNELNRLQPKFFDKLDAEATKVEDLEDAYRNLFKEMLRQEQAKAFMTEINKLESERIAFLIEEDKRLQQLEDTRRRAAEGDPSLQKRTVTVTTEEGDKITTERDPVRFAEMEFESYQRYAAKQIKDLESQAKRFEGMMQDRGLFELLLGDPQKVTPGSATVAVREMEDIMAELAKKLKVIEARKDALNLSDLDVSKEKLTAYTKAFEDLIVAGVDGQDVGNNIKFVGDAVTGLNNDIEKAEQIQELADILEDLDRKLAKINRRMTGAISGPESKLKSLKAEQQAIGDAIAKLQKDTPGATEEIANLQKQYDELTPAIAKANEELLKYQQRQQMIETITNGSVDAFFSLGSAMGDLTDSTVSLGRRMVNSIAKSVAAMLKQVYVQFALNAIQNSTHPLHAIALMGIGAGAISGFLNSIPALAQGGIAVGPQLAVVGDNRSGREAIIPLEKLPGLMQKMGGGMGGRLYGSLDGYDIVLSNERNNRLMQRSSR